MFVKFGLELQSRTTWKLNEMMNNEHREQWTVFSFSSAFCINMWNNMVPKHSFYSFKLWKWLQCNHEMAAIFYGRKWNAVGLKGGEMIVKREKKKCQQLYLLEPRKYSVFDWLLCKRVENYQYGLWILHRQKGWQSGWFFLVEKLALTRNGWVHNEFHIY